MSSKDEEKSSLFKGLFSAFGRLIQEKKLSTFSMRSTTVTIKVNGVAHTINTASDLNEETLRQLASQAGISLDHVMDLLHASGAFQSTQQTTKSGNVEQVGRSITLTACPKCHRNVPQTSKCLYCGQALQSTVASKETTNEVDKQFLEADVIPENKTKEQEKQQIRDTFEDRLKNL